VRSSSLPAGSATAVTRPWVSRRRRVVAPLGCEMALMRPWASRVKGVGLPRPREVAVRALQYRAAAVIFAHNHPSGIASPSNADKRITERLNSALALLDIRVLDHVIVGRGQSYSFAESGLL